MTIPVRKARMRRAVIDRIGAMDPADRHQQERRLIDLFDQLPGFAMARTVLMSVSAFPEEVPTAPLLARVLEAGKRLVCPRVVVSPPRLDLYEVSDPQRDLVAGHRSILEPGPGCLAVAPSEIDWVLTPGLAFDRSGFRLGRGGGFYDRLLPTLRPDAASWALILDAQWIAEIPRESHDRPVSGVVDHRWDGMGL